METKKGKLSFGARGWLLVIYGFLTIALASGLPSTIQVALGSFVEKGFNSTHLLSLMTYGSWGTLVLLLILGVAGAKKRKSIRKMGLILGVGWAVFTALWGVTDNEVLFTIFYIAAFLCCQAMVLLVVNNLVANWFPTRKGTVIGLITTGFMLGAMAGVMLFAPLLTAVGSLVFVYIILAAVILIVTLIGFFGLRDFPEEIGCFPDNDRNMTSEQALKMLEEAQKQDALSPWSQKRVLATWQMWMISIACGIMLLFSSVISSQLVVRLLMAGYAPEQATTMFISCCLIGCFGSWAIGFVDNRIGPKKATIITMAVMVVACIFTTLGNDVCMWIALAFLGIELGGSSNFTTSLVVHYWGRFNFMKVYGVVVIIQQIIGAFGALFASTTSTAWGYDVTYYIMAGMSVVAILVMIPVKEGFVKKKENTWEEQK